MQSRRFFLDLGYPRKSGCLEVVQAERPDRLPDRGHTGVPAHVFVAEQGRIAFVSSGFTEEERYDNEMRWRIEELRETAGL